MDDALVALANCLNIGKSNHRLSSTHKSNEPTIQVVLDALKLTPFYKAFQITANVLEIYMQEFWAAVSIHHKSLRFKMNDKIHTLNLENFRDKLQICPRLPGQKFEDPPLEEEILSFIRDLGHTGEIKVLTDSLCLLRAQNIWGMYHKKNVDYVYLLWEDLVYQVENKNSKKSNDMCYPRFTKVIIDYFMTKDQSISRKNKMFWHTARDDPMFNTIRVISRHQDTQIYGDVLPDELTNQDMKDSEAHKQYYAVASGAEPLKAKTKYMKKADESDTSLKKKTAPVTKGSILKTSAKATKSVKKKQPAKKPITKGLTVLSKVALSESEQLNMATKKSKIQFHSSHTSGSGDGFDTQSKVLDEQQQNVSDTNEGAGDDDDDNDEHDLEDEKDDEDDDDKNDSDETELDDDKNDFKVSTPPDHEFTEEEENQEGDDYVKEGEQEDEEKELYEDLNINLERSDAEMTDAQTNQDTEDTYVTLTIEPLVVQQQSSSISSDLVSKYINPFPDTVQETNQFAEAVFSISAIVDNYFASKLKDAVDVAIQLQSNKLKEEAQAKNEEFLKQIDSNMKAIIKEQTSYVVAVSLSEFELKKILIDKMEENKSINNSDIHKNLYNALVELYNSDKDIISSYGYVVTLKRGRDDQDKDEDPSAGSNRGSKRSKSGKEAESSKKPTHKESKSTSFSKGASRSHPKSLGKSAQAEEHGQKITQLAQAAGTQSSFNEFLATPIDFSAFIINRLKIENLTQDVLTGPTYDIMKGTCKSVVELEYHLEEVFKATNDQKYWHNTEGRPYPHDLSKPLPLILNARGRQVIPFDHFINNDLEHLKGGSLSQRYTTSITKMKAADYGQVKWIKDKGPKRHKFYRYAANMETSKDVYSRHRIIAVTSLKIRQDIEDMLLLLVQGKLTNLNLDERYALNVALRMYTRRIVICVEDLKLGAESYQQKINLSRPDSNHSDLKKMTPYTAYLDIQGIIYQDDMDRTRLMRTEELHKFSDGTLNHVRTTLNDIATGIQMEYFPKRKWSKQDKQRA
ncbi:hypothetical protein Tco_1343612 [Tanacetum coccineum]